MKNYKSLTIPVGIVLFLIASFCLHSIPVFATDSVPITSYDEFRSAVIGRAFDVDGEGSYQCYDGAALLWQQLGRSLDTGEDDAKGTWLHKKDENAGEDFLLIYNINEVKRGDVVVFDYNAKNFNWTYIDDNGQLRSPGHIAFADNDYAASNSLNIFGQNQLYHPEFTVQENVSVDSFLGAFRLKRWADKEPPTINSTDVTYSNITGKSFDVSFNISDNNEISEVYIKLMTSAGEHYGNFATTTPIKGTYDPDTQTANVHVDLASLNILSDLYIVTCYGKDLSGNESDPLRSKDPVSPFFISTDTCGEYKAIKETPILNYPGAVDYPGADRVTNEKIAKGNKVTVIGTITIDGVRYHRIEAERFEGETGSLWVKADDMEYYESLISKVWNWLLDHASEMVCFFGHKVISQGENGIVVQSGKIITSAKEVFSPAYVQALADSGTAIIPQENSEYSIEFNTADGEITITIAEYLGYGGNVTVPADIGGYRVTAIKSGAFNNCSNLISISLPEGITSIPDNCFKDCISLTRVELPTTARWIGDDAFSGCEWLESITNLSYVTHIGESAFYGGKSITAVTLSNELERIEASTFEGCTGLTELTIPDSVTSIGRSAFAGCEGITELTIPDSVTDIDKYAFAGFTGLKKLTCPGNLRYVVSDSGVFSGCTSLESIKLTGEGGIPGYSTFDVQETPWGISSRAGTELTIEIDEGITGIGSWAFYGCGNITGINIPETVTGIGEYAFYNCSLMKGSLPGPLSYIGRSAFEGCSSLTGVIVLSDEVTSIGEYTFSGCSSLEGVLTIPDSVTSIGQSAFAGCEGITELTIPDSVTYIGYYAFAGFTGLKKLTCPGNLNYIVSDLQVFSDCTSLESIKFTGEGEISGYSSYSVQETPWGISSGAGTELTIEIDEGITGIGSWAFYGCGNITGINIPETVTEIGQYAFYNCSLMKGSLPGPLSYIGRSAFEGCSSLTGVIMLSDEITSIGEYTFSGCSSLEGALTIPDSVTWIGRDAFAGCEGITELTIPDSVTDIGYYAFAGFTGLKKLTCPGNLSYVVSDLQVFSDCTSLESIKFTGEGGIPGYSTFNVLKTPWYISSEAGTELTIEIDEGITEIGDSAFRGCSSISTVYLPFSTDIISANAFGQCTGLSDVYFDGSEMEAGGILIGSGNTELNSATWHYALENPSEDLTLKLPDQLKVIEEEAFTGMSAEVIIIPASVETIKSGAFVGCADLKAIIFEGSPESVANDIVSNPENVTVFVIKDSDTEAWARQAGFRVKYMLN